MIIIERLPKCPRCGSEPPKDPRQDPEYIPRTAFCAVCRPKDFERAVDKAKRAIASGALPITRGDGKVLAEMKAPIAWTTFCIDCGVPVPAGTERAKAPRRCFKHWLLRPAGAA